MDPIKYASLAVDEYEDIEQGKEKTNEWRKSIVNPCKPSNALRNALAMGCGILFLSAYAFSKSPLDFRAMHTARRDDMHLPALPTYQLDPELISHLGPYGPRHVIPSKFSSEAPKGCDVSMISILQRHGARYPTGDGEGARIDAALGKLSQVTNVTDPSLQFVLDFKYPYIADQLVLLGQKQ
ncbi:unnamed protein product [Rhizoctonia solani]|uniref:3-phytase A n=1 Tax=Rhizoctonia solani TaxID=456999 RepID=A0A8H3EAL2_9AGAM|nr:unnamed protein product [Rhizoctonia solani]